MKKYLILLLIPIVAGLVFANVSVAQAHWWNTWPYHHHTSSWGVYVYGTASAASREVVREWSNKTDINLSQPTSHSGISLFNGWYGQTGWSGLASIESVSWQWHCFYWCNISHFHSRSNDYYFTQAQILNSSVNSPVRGILCQELGHAFLLGHYAGDCMGKTYFSPCWLYTTDAVCNTINSHTVADINSRY